MTWWMIKRAMRMSGLAFRLSLAMLLWAGAVWVKTRGR
jgi:hypothetical protein